MRPFLELIVLCSDDEDGSGNSDSDFESTSKENGVSNHFYCQQISYRY